MTWTKLNIKSPIDEKRITDSILRQLPSPTASLKIIKEELQLDKEALLEELLANPKLKGKLDGMNITLERLDKRYIHGGGDTVSAGTNVTITNVNGTKQINASGGSGFTILTTASTIDDSNVTFVFTGTPSIVVINGQAFNAGATSGGVVVWTNVTVTVTLANPVGVGGSIFAYA